MHEVVLREGDDAVLLVEHRLRLRGREELRLLQRDCEAREIGRGGPQTSGRFLREDVAAAGDRLVVFMRPLAARLAHAGGSGCANVESFIFAGPRTSRSKISSIGFFSRSMSNCWSNRYPPPE